MFELVQSTNKADHKLLTSAAQGSVADILQQLSRSANVDCCDSKGRTPLWLASDVGHADSVEALLKARADKNSAAFLRPTKSFRGGTTPLHQAAVRGHASVVRLLLAYSADANAQAGDGRSPLMVSAVAGHVEVVKLLLTDGADPSAKDNGMNTALRLLLLAQNSTSLKPPTAALKGKRQEVINILRELRVQDPERYVFKREGRSYYLNNPQHQSSASTSEPDTSTRSGGKATRSGGKAEVVWVPGHMTAAQWERLGAQLAPDTYGFYSAEASTLAEDRSWGWDSIMWEAFQQFSAVGQKLAAGGGSFVPGLYLVAIGLKLLNEIMDTNASADELTQRLYRLCCSIVEWLHSLLRKAAGDDSILLRVEKLLKPLAFVLRDVKSFIEKQPGAWAPSRLFTAGSRQATAQALQDKLDLFLKELQLADFMVNLDTREHVQKLQLEVKECSDGLCSLQHHLETGFAEVKDKIDETHDRMQAQLARVLQEVQSMGLRLDPKTEAKSQELKHELGRMDSVQHEKLLATVTVLLLLLSLW
ncbi:hypothetical protein ABBQ38_011161 [Trebouxia sp. C0009 RCD-2024]